MSINKGYRLVLYTTDSGIIVSPTICPNNPKHDYNHVSIIKEIHNTGRSMVRRLDEVLSYSIKID